MLSPVVVDVVVVVADVECVDVFVLVVGVVVEPEHRSELEFLYKPYSVGRLVKAPTQHRIVFST